MSKQKNPLTFASWNVNGLRAVHKKNFLNWMQDDPADVVCLQEIKVSEAQVKAEEALEHPHGYNSVFSFAEKAGYSGLAIYSKHDPQAVRNGLGIAEFDREGRWLEADFGTVTLINSYFPNSQRDHARLPYKLNFLESAHARLTSLRDSGREVILCGDFNIAHKEIDLKNPKTNTKNAGFLPEERAWMDQMVGKLGWLDAFREFEKGPDHYTWWSYRPGVREKNIGWRLDYFLTNPEWKDRLQNVRIAPHILGSDHCPVNLSLKP